MPMMRGNKRSANAVPAIDKPSRAAISSAGIKLF